MPRADTKELHARATDMMTKCLALHPDERVAFVNEVLQDADFTDAELKRVHELVRKCCEARDKVAISLHTVPWHDPRQIPLDFHDISPGDFT